MQSAIEAGSRQIDMRPLRRHMAGMALGHLRMLAETPRTKA